MLINGHILIQKWGHSIELQNATSGIKHWLLRMSHQLMLIKNKTRVLLILDRERSGDADQQFMHFEINLHALCLCLINWIKLLKAFSFLKQILERKVYFQILLVCFTIIILLLCFLSFFFILRIMSQLWNSRWKSNSYTKNGNSRTLQSHRAERRAEGGKNERTSSTFTESKHGFDWTSTFILCNW